jgi:transposase-like protein
MSDTTNTIGARPVSPLDELVREGARQLLQRALELEVAEVLAQFDDVRDDAGRHRVVSNGHLPERTLLTGAGPLDLRQPRVRDRAGKEAPDQVRFTSAILPPYLRRSPSMDALIPWLYLKGISAADMGEALQSLVGTNAANLSAGVVLKLKEEWSRELEAWKKRDLVASEYVYVWADGIVRHEALFDRVGCKGPPPACRSRSVKLGAAWAQEARARVGAAPTTTGRAGTARRSGSGKQDGKV